MKINDNHEYIIVEVIPTRIRDGEIVQISALKLKGLNLLDRFDYRLDLDKILIPDLLNMVSYDDDKFNHCSSGSEILDLFSKWSENLDLFIIDNEYTKNYLGKLDNKLVSIFKYLDMEYSDDVIDRVIDKYKLESSNYIVDLLYEALINQSNENKEV